MSVSSQITNTQKGIREFRNALYIHYVSGITLNKHCRTSCVVVFGLLYLPGPGPNSCDEQSPIGPPHPPKRVIVVYRSIQNPHRPGIAWAARSLPTAGPTAAHRTTLAAVSRALIDNNCINLLMAASAGRGLYFHYSCS